MFHGVMDLKGSPAWQPLRPQLSPTTLDEYLRILSRYFSFVTIDHALEMLTGKVPLQPYSIVLTFDDGLRNFKEHALPVLEKYKAPATVYVATNHVEQQIPFWFDRLDYALQLLDGEPYSVNIGNEIITFVPGDREALAKAYKQMRYSIKKKQISDEEMQDLLYSTATLIEKKYGRSLKDIIASDPWCGIMNWSELKELAAAGITVGSHTVNHCRLAFVTPEKAEQELQNSKRAIEENLGLACNHFCYPIGSCNGQVADLVREAGYQSAVTTKYGFNRIGDDPMKLCRFHVPYGTDGEGVETLLYRISGLEAFFSKIKRFFIWKKS